MRPSGRRMVNMDHARKVVTRVRRRLSFVRFVDRIQVTAALTAPALLAVVAGARLLGSPVSVLPAFAAAVFVAMAAALALSLFSPISRARAASEADRILDSRERISTALAVSEGRAEDPLGFGPAVARAACDAARGATDARIRKSITPRFRMATLIAAACAALLLLVPLLPMPGIADPGEDPPAAEREREKVAEALRALERKLERRSAEADRKTKEAVKELLERLRDETARLRGERPRRPQAMARLADLERRARDEARRFAGMKPVEAETEKLERKDLEDLADALRAFEQADLAGTKERFSKLWDKLRTDDLGKMTAAEAAYLARQASELSRAVQRLAGATGQNSELAKMLEGLAADENMQKLAQALEKLRQALGENAPQPPDNGEMEEALRNYRTLEMSDEEIEEMLRQIEELLRMIEAGEEIKLCRGSMSGLIGLGLGLGGGGPSGRTAGRPGPSAGGGNGTGNDTGGSGQGRGGDPGTTNDGRTTSQDLIPGQVSQAGNATLIRTIRSLPDPDEEPEAYERLLREATLEAEEAIRRGDIPRRYRGYVRRFFGGAEDE